MDIAMANVNQVRPEQDDASLASDLKSRLCDLVDELAHARQYFPDLAYAGCLKRYLVRYLRA